MRAQKRRAKILLVSGVRYKRHRPPQGHVCPQAPRATLNPG